MGSPQPHQLTSLVLLLKQARTLSADALRAAASGAFNLPFSNDKADENFLVLAQPNMYPLKIGDNHLGIISSDEPYWADPDVIAETVSEPGLGELVRRHRAWLSVDWFDGPAETDPRERYRLLARMAARLLSEDCLGLTCTASNRILKATEELREVLLSKNPAQVLDPDAAFLAREDDPRMQAAIAQAKRRWPLFILHWSTRKPEDDHFVKAEFSDGANSELMWVLVESIDNGRIVGTLQNQPSYIGHLQLGATVELKVSDVVDFLYKDGGKSIGGFTDAVLLDE